MKQELIKVIALPEKVNASLKDSVLGISGPNGQITRAFTHPQVELHLGERKISVFSKRATKREKKMIGSFFSHIKNMVSGVVNPYVYRLKICSGHFPMNVSVTAKELLIKNFLGEAVPRKVSLLDDVKVKVSGSEITVISVDKEKAGLVAARIEKACRITNRDLRVFQDGCYIIEKAGREAPI